jgi:hypothetical protein
MTTFESSPLPCFNVIHNEINCRVAHIPSGSWCANCVEQDERDETEYQSQLGEIEAEAAYERWLENGGPHAASIQDDLDQEERMFR